MKNRTYHRRGELVHGYTAKAHPLHNIWVIMKQRCCNPKNPAYKHYGARGITVCERWNDFKNFANDMGMRPSEAHSLDRIDNDKGYAPENCRWASASEQRFNRRTFKNSTTGVCGVQPNGHGRFTSMVHINKCRHYLGTFDTIEEASNARQEFLAKKA